MLIVVMAGESMGAWRTVDGWGWATVGNPADYSATASVPQDHVYSCILISVCLTESILRALVFNLLNSSDLFFTAWIEVNHGNL